MKVIGVVFIYCYLFISTNNLTIVMIALKYFKKDHTKLVITTIRYIFVFHFEFYMQVVDIYIPNQQKKSILGKVLV